MEKYWAHFTGASVFVLAILALQITRIATGSSGLQDVVLETVIGVIVVGGTVGVVLGVFRYRGGPATARRRKIASVEGITWLADVFVDDDSARTLKITSSAALRPRTYALTATSTALGFWERASDDKPTANIPLERIEKATAPMADFAATSGQFSIELPRGEELDLELSNPVIWGMYPATPNQVQRVTDAINRLAGS